MSIAKTLMAAAIAAAAFAAPIAASAQQTGTRLPPHPDNVVEGVTVIGAIDDGKQTQRGEEPADLAMADIPAVYDDAPVITAPQAPAAPQADPSDQ